MGQTTSGSPSSRSHSHGGGTNNLPPLLFHNVHGENIRVSRDGTVARRVESFCKGIAFSSRPIKINEKICIKFLQISSNWSGVIRFGFTYNDPSALRHGLPRYACPDLTNRPGYWAKALPESYGVQGSVLFYYVTSAGNVHFGVNGEEKGVFFGGVETRGPLWALVDVYGNSTAVEFVDVRHQLNNSRRSVGGGLGDGGLLLEEELERTTCRMQHIQIQQRDAVPQPPPPPPPDELPLLRHQPRHLHFHPMPLHRTKGRNVRHNQVRGIAHRTDAEFCQGYVFTARPLQLGERIVVQVLATEPMFQGCLGLGLTSCDPGSLRDGDLPDDSSFLLDRPEYWVISRDFARNLSRGDEIGFCISGSGEVQISRNGAAPSVVIHVDQTLRLWAFFDVYGSTQRIRVLTSTTTINATTPTRNTRVVATPTASESINSLNSQSELRRNSAVAAVGARVLPADVQVQAAANGGTVLSVILPPPQVVGQQQGGVPVVGYREAMNGTTARQVVIAGAVAQQNGGSMVSSCSGSYVEAIDNSPTTPYAAPMATGASPTIAWLEQNGVPPPPSAGAECTICYENHIDAVLYMCGHMCMCYECALQQWRGKGGGQCPLCRAEIRDVIRTYKS